MGGEVTELHQLASELAGAAPLPKLSEVHTRLSALAAQVGATPGDLKALVRPTERCPRRRSPWRAAKGAGDGGC